MEIETKYLKPGMILIDDVNGKSGKPIVEKDTVLTELEIEFIQKFLIDKVNVSMFKGENRNDQRRNLQIANKKTEHKKTTTVKEKTDSFLTIFNEVVEQYHSLYTSWQANIPVNMYHVRQLCLPLFELVETKQLTYIKSLLNDIEKNLFSYKCVAVSLLAIKLAQQLNYEKKDWLQIGFAAILIDIGLTKSKPAINSETTDNRHPIISYEMIKDEPTLTKNAKIAIVQHHERLDGTGFPLKLTAEKIHPFSRIIAVADRYFTLIAEGKNADSILVKQMNKFDERIVRLL